MANNIQDRTAFIPNDNFFNNSKYDTVKSTIDFPRRILKIIKVWPCHDQNDLISFTLCLMCVFNSYSQAGYLLLTNMNLEIAAICVLSSFASVLAFSKLLTFYFHKDNLIKILEALERDFFPCYFFDIGQELKIYYKILTCYFKLLFIMGMAFVVAYLTKGLLEGHPLPSRYPLDNTNTNPIPEIMMVFQCFIVLFLLLILCGTDYLLFAMIYNICAQYKVLQKMFSKIGSGEEEMINNIIRKFKKETGDGYDRTGVTEARKLLNNCVQHQAMLNRVIALLEESLNIANAVYMTTTICVLAFNIAFVTKPHTTVTAKLSSIGASMYFAFELLLFCGMGNELSYQSSLLTQYIFSNHWYILNDKSLKKDLVFILMCSRKSAKLSAFKFLDVGFEMFLKVSRLTFSFYTLVSNTVPEELS